MAGGWFALFTPVPPGLAVWSQLNTVFSILSNVVFNFESELFTRRKEWLDEIRAGGVVLCSSGDVKKPAQGGLVSGV